MKKNDFAKLHQKHFEEFEMYQEKVRFKWQLKTALKDSEEKKAEIEALKRELQKAHSSSPIDQTMISKEDQACDKENEPKVDQLKATIGHLTNELKNAEATMQRLRLEIEDKECKCSITRILDADLEKKVDQLEKAHIDIEDKMAEIEHLKATISHLTTELKNAKATIDIEFEDKECKCSLTKILNTDLEKELDKLKSQLEKAITDPEEKRAEIEALKSELQRAHSSSPADKTMTIKEEHAGDKDREAEIAQLKLTIGHLTNELKNSKATINIEFKDKECKCSVTKILNIDLEKKVEKLKDLLNLREKEIRALTEMKIELINLE
jgi:predicted RNase H-like nuclease (RuvC/YqgF family)